MHYEDEYLRLVDTVSQQPERETRNAVTRSQFGVQYSFDELQRHVLPILQGRKMYWKGVVGELAAFLKGPKNLASFTDEGCNFWEQWATKKGALTLDYGNAWRDFDGVDQLTNVVESLREDPNGRRHLITGWRPDRLSKLSLPCCHYSYQWYVNGSDLEMIWIQRSVDLLVGLPSNILSAALFNILMAKTVGLQAGKVTMQLGDVHVYEGHTQGLEKYREQYLDSNIYSLASWKLDKDADVFNFTSDMFKVINYEHEPAIPFEVAK